MQKESSANRRLVPTIDLEAFLQCFEDKGIFFGVVKIDQLMDQQVYFESHLSISEKAYYQALSKLTRRLEFLGSRFVLKQCLLRVLSRPETEGTGAPSFRDISVSRNTDQAPTLIIQGEENRGDICFSISHCTQYVFCGVSLTRKLGVDVERISGRLSKVRDTFIQPEEETVFREAVLTSANKNELYTKLWTAKEAAVKYVGTHMFHGLTQCRVNRMAPKELHLDYHHEGHVIPLLAHCEVYDNHVFTIIYEL